MVIPIGTRLLSFAAAAMIAGASVSAQTSQTMQRSDNAYEFGTNSAMLYFVEQGVRLRVTLLLDECGLPSLSQEVGSPLPNSIDWFVSSTEASKVPPEDVPFAAQVTRAYLLGLETGIRLEFRRLPKEEKELTCSAAAMIARDYIHD